MKFVTLLFSLIAVASLHTHAQEDDPGRTLTPPNLIFEHAARIGISEKQQQDIREAVEAIHRDSNPEARQAALGAASEALTKALGSESVDETEALAKLDALLAAEAEMKRIHLKILIASNRLLTPAQRMQLREIGNQHKQNTQAPGRESEETANRLKAKIERIRSEVEARTQSGDNPFEIPPMMDQFSKSMQEGKIDAAEQILDKVLRELGIEEKKDAAAPINPGTPVPIGEATPEALKSRIDEWRVPEVAWRKIGWRTCLLDGIQASVEQKKPIILWMFIDLPIDDKRC